jgi:hypothetical protein
MANRKKASMESMGEENRKGPGGLGGVELPLFTELPLRGLLGN